VRSFWPASLGLVISWATAGPALAQEPSPDPSAVAKPAGEDPLRAAIEELSFLVGGIVWYVIDERNVLDWDFDSVEERFSEHAYRFDNNQFPINFLGHPFSGAAYYALPRANRLSMPVSALYAIATSLLWEFAIEFKERFSINDIVATPLGGMAIGEPFFRLGQYAVAELHPALAWTFGLPVAIHDALDGRPVGVEGDSAGASATHHEIRLGYGVGWAHADRNFDLHTVSGSMRFVALPEHGREGASTGLFADAEVARLRIDGFFSSVGSGVELVADTMLLGARFSEVREDPSGHRFGGAILAGTSLSHRYRFERYEPWHDRLTFTGFPGLGVDAEGLSGQLRARFSGRLQGGFGASHAALLGAWREAHPDAQPKTILSNHGYYFGWGFSGLLELELSLRGLALGGSLAYLRIDSQEGLDRRQDLVTDDVDANDELLEVAGWLRASFSPGLFVELAARGQLRASTLGDVRGNRGLTRYQIAVGLEL
jgi:hypothetical protein